MKTTSQKRKLTAAIGTVFVSLVLAAPDPSDASGFGKTIIARALKQDLSRDIATPARALSSTRNAHRDTSRD